MTKLFREFVSGHENYIGANMWEIGDPDIEDRFLEGYQQFLEDFCTENCDDIVCDECPQFDEVTRKCDLKYETDEYIAKT